jgi:hypothetical protein
MTWINMKTIIAASLLALSIGSAHAQTVASPDGSPTWQTSSQCQKVRATLQKLHPETHAFPQMAERLEGVFVFDVSAPKAESPKLSLTLTCDAFSASLPMDATFNPVPRIRMEPSAPNPAAETESR